MRVKVAAGIQPVFGVKTLPMQQLVPHLILESLANGELSGSWQAAALVIDISGFSDITDTLMDHGQHGAEVLASLMGSVFEPLVESVYAQAGFVATLAGDGFTAIFPPETESAAPAPRAVAAAVAMQEWMAGVAQRDTPYGSVEVAIKIGVGTGDVTWGIVGAEDESKAAYYFSGSAVDCCVQAEAQAPAGEIVLDATTCRQLGETVRVEPLADHFRLKGLGGQLPGPRDFEPPDPDPQLMARFFPRWPLAAAQSGEFRQVLSLFVRLPNVNTAAQLTDVMHTVFTLMDRYGGLLSKLDLGDRGTQLVLFWGAPVAYENDVERALSFALYLQQQTALPVQAGITSRISRAGYVGGAWRGVYTCYGRGVNLAARFMAATAPGQVWLDENTARRASHQFELEYAGEKAFKGFAQKQKVYVLLERKESVETIYRQPMVGRERELQALSDFVAPIFRGQYAGLLTVRGEAGIGKSRLIHTFKATTANQATDVLWARCQTDEILRESLNPFRYWLRDYFDISDSLAESSNKRTLNQRLDDLISATDDERQAKILDQARSFLAALVDLHVSDSLYERLDAQGRYENTLLGLIALFQAESRRQPLIIFLEDTQWLDEDSKRFLVRLMRALSAGSGESVGAKGSDYPVAILATSRLGEGDLPAAVPPGGEIVLEELDSDDLARLAETHLGMPASSRLLDLLDDRTEGNPFFAEQILQYLQEQGLLQERDGEWDIVTPTHRALLPRDVRAVMVARLDRLAQDVKETVQTASVLGREFEVRMLAWMLGDERLSQKMAEIESAAIWSGLSELRYLFRHALLRDTAYRTQVRARRQALHALAVEAIENLYAAELQKHFGQVAYHCERAGMLAKAREYSLSAAHAAKESYQNTMAIDYYNRALAHTPNDNFEGRYALHREREAVYALLGKQDERQEDLEALAELASTLQDVEKRADVLSRQALSAHDIGDYAQAVRLAKRSITLARRVGAPAIEISAYNVWSNALLRQGRLQMAAFVAAKGRDLALRNEDRHGEGKLLNNLGQINFEMGDLVAARSYFEQSLQIARELGERRSEAQALNNLGMVAGYQDDYSGAQHYYQQSLAIVREIGERSGEGLVLGNLGWLAGMMGNYEKARALAEENVQIAREVGDRYGEAYALINLSSYSNALGDYTRALDHARKGEELAERSGDRSAEAWSLTYCGHSLLALQELPEARQTYEKALELRQVLQQPTLALEPAAGLARISLADGEVSKAMEQLQSFLNHLDDGATLEGADDPLRIYLTAYLVLRANHDPRANSILEEGYRLLQERAARIKDEARRTHYLEEIPHHRQIVTAWEQHLENPVYDASVAPE